MFNWFKKKKPKLNYYNYGDIVYYKGSKWIVIHAIKWSFEDFQALKLRLDSDEPYCNVVIDSNNYEVKPVIRC